MLTIKRKPAVSQLITILQAKPFSSASSTCSCFDESRETVDKQNHRRHILWPQKSISLNHVQKRGLREHWHRALPYPPEKTDADHHFFLPSLREQLDQLEAKNNPVVIHDIGFTQDQFLEKFAGLKPEHKEAEQSVSLSGKWSSRKAKSIEPPPPDPLALIKSPEDILKLTNIEIKRKQLNYDSYTIKWLLSQEGKEDIINLAHHYQIFRDAFSSPSQKPIEPENKPAKVSVPKVLPAVDQTSMEEQVLKEWFSGAVPLSPPKPRDIYYFTPHIPIYAEFSVPEDHVRKNGDEPFSDSKKAADDELITTPVFRGNLIQPVMAAFKPNLVLDFRASIQEDEDSIHLKSYFDEIDVNENVKLLIPENSTLGDKYSTLVMMNLDTQFGDEKPVCHWMLANIKTSKESKVTYDEVMSYLPVYGIRGLGYHRYVFMLFHHPNRIDLPKIESNDLKERMFDPKEFVDTNGATPIGLSWFQTIWDSFSQKVIHNVLGKF